MAELFKVGTDCFIDAYDIVDADGAQLDVTGYAVRAVARAYHEHGEILTVWSTTPDPGEGTIIAGGDVIDRIRLVVTPEQTERWDCYFVLVQAETVNLVGRTSRPIHKVFQVSQEAVI